MIGIINVILLIVRLVVAWRKWKVTPRYIRKAYIVSAGVFLVWAAGGGALGFWSDRHHISNAVSLPIILLWIIGVPIAGCFWARAYEMKHKRLTAGDQPTGGFPVIQQPCSAVPVRVLPLVQPHPRRATVPPQVKYDPRLENWAFNLVR